MRTRTGRETAGTGTAATRTMPGAGIAETAATTGMAAAETMEATETEAPGTETLPTRKRITARTSATSCSP